MHGHYATGEIVMESSQEREVTLQAPCYTVESPAYRKSLNAHTFSFAVRSEITGVLSDL